ncbi:phosphate signaling complex protein PhoU [Terriglobus roseus]|uniref:Phosphate-specific transport system accessory protein PhoU n=1 Tax=Terriglobus roseus TaxID=392734 RepID=A0A1H4TUM5_9BACT|nr:phosphate signaling complex protein PhoU [Terriglobus roseus]SEC59970.1 phosphate uptake regulator, PhoU [Terriglobus roseus]
MPRIHFQQQLATLKDKLLAMAALSQQALELSVEAYLQRDTGLCDHVQDIEAAINAAERAVGEMAYELLAKEQPMAMDLRFIMAVIKINGDLERVGDQAVAIVKRCGELQKFDPNAGPENLPGDIAQMGVIAVKMIRRAIRSLLEGDPVLAEKVLDMDDEIDRLNHETQAALRDEMMRRPEVTENALNSIIVARNLERSADHATNIAEDVIFWVRGSDVRHKAATATVLQ